MIKKDTENYYFNEDILLLMLAVLDYPSGSKNIFSFDELKATGFKKINNKKIFDWVFDFMNSNKISLDAFTFEGVKTWDYYEGNKFDILVPYMKERIPLMEQTASILNFKIKINKSAQNKLLKTLEQYMSFFINGKLFSEDGERYFSFAKHKEKFLSIVGNYIADREKEIMIKDSDFADNDDYKFIECILALENQDYLKYISIKFEDDHHEAKFFPTAKLFRELKGEKPEQKERQTKMITLPPRTTWDHIKIKFINEQDIEIWIKNKRRGRYSFEDLKCINTKNGKPDKQWKLLLKLAASKGEVDLNEITDSKIRDRLRQHKMSLLKKLEEFFGLQEPFHEFIDEKKYKLRFEILPEPILRRDGNPKNYGKDIKFGDLKGFYKDQTL